MFTEGTKQFGIWRAGHPSLNRYAGRPTQAILLAYGFCAFLTWLIFILTVKIRGDFFLIESMNIPLHSVVMNSVEPVAPFNSALSLAVREAGEAGKSRLVFDTGESFLIPDEQESVKKFIEARVDQIELTALLKKELSPHLGRAVLWVDRRVPLESVRPLTRSLVNAGFDRLSFAVSAKNPEQTEAH